MSRPVKIALLTAAVACGVVGFVWLGSSTVQPAAESVPQVAPPGTQPVVPTPGPAAVAPAPRSSASFAPMPAGIDMRQNLPDLRDAGPVRRRLRLLRELGLTVDITEGESDDYGWPTDRDGIESAIAELRGEMHDCIDGYGPEVGGFDGRVVMGFDVSADAVEAGVAYPQELLVTGSDVPQAVVSCMTSVYSNMPFEPPTDGVLHVDYPVQLSFDDE